MNERGGWKSPPTAQGIDYRDIPSDIEARQIAEAVRIHAEVAGARPLGFYQGRSSINTVRLDRKWRFVYCAKPMDDLPYWLEGPRGPQLMIPIRWTPRHALLPHRSSTPANSSTYLKDPSTLYARAMSRQMLSIGLLPPGRSARRALALEIVDYALSRDRLDPTGSTSPGMDRENHPRAAGSPPAYRTCSSSASAGFTASPWTRGGPDAGLKRRRRGGGVGRALRRGGESDDRTEARPDRSPVLAGGIALTKTLTPIQPEPGKRRQADGSRPRGGNSSPTQRPYQSFWLSFIMAVKSKGLGDILAAFRLITANDPTPRRRRLPGSPVLQRLGSRTSCLRRGAASFAVASFVH
jgi:hypothetical protein